MPENLKDSLDKIAGKRGKVIAIDEEVGKTKAKKLPKPVVEALEEAFGTKGLKKVRVHTGGNAPDICKALNAKTFTIGENIFLKKANMAADNRLLAHELGHVVQQTGGRKMPPEKPGKVIISGKK